MPPIQIGPMTFKTKAAAKARYSAVLNIYQTGEVVSVLDGHLLWWLLEMHPEAAQKIGPGVQLFRVIKTSYGTKCFGIERVDGTTTDFSFNACIDGANGRKDRLQALRAAVDDQVCAFKAEAFEGVLSVPCAIRGTPTGFLNAHIDHVPPNTFMSLVGRWMMSCGLKLEDVEITPPADNQVTALMTDELQRQSWWLHHKQHANLRILCREANLSDARKR